MTRIPCSTAHRVTVHGQSTRGVGPTTEAPSLGSAPSTASRGRLYMRDLLRCSPLYTSHQVLYMVCYYRTSGEREISRGAAELSEKNCKKPRAKIEQFSRHSLKSQNRQNFLRGGSAPAPPSPRRAPSFFRLTDRRFLALFCTISLRRRRRRRGPRDRMFFYCMNR